MSKQQLIRAQRKVWGDIAQLCATPRCEHEGARKIEVYVCVNASNDETGGYFADCADADRFASENGLRVVRPYWCIKPPTSRVLSQIPNVLAQFLGLTPSSADTFHKINR
jgi:hypothetical protein